MLQTHIQAGTLTKYAAATGSKLTANSGTAVISINESGGYITFPAATSYVEGRYRYVITDSDGVVSEAGFFYMMPSLASGDGRTKNQKILDLIDGVIEGRADKNQLSVAVGDKSIRYMSHEELLNMRSHYADLVDNEMASLQGINDQSYCARFNAP